MIDYFVLFIIIIISFDTTLFLQSLISQPIFSCQLIGILVGNYDFGISVGFISQVFFLSYVPVGGAKILDIQMGPNLAVLLFQQKEGTVEQVGLLIPLILLLSFLFLGITMFERRILTNFIKKTPYEKLYFKSMFFLSFSLHFVLFFVPAFLLIYFWKTFLQVYLQLSLFNGEGLYYFGLFFGFGSLLVRYYKRGFSH